MISICEISSAEGAAAYFSQADYYEKDHEVAKPRLRGALLKELGITGTYTSKKFKALLEGKDPKTGAVLVPQIRNDFKPENSERFRTEMCRSLIENGIAADAAKDQIDRILKGIGVKKLPKDEAKKLSKSFRSWTNLQNIEDGQKKNILAAFRPLAKVNLFARERRLGLDMTMSAPKSVSLLALVKGDKEVLKAHGRAVADALRYIEDSCAMVTEGSRNSRRIAYTKNFAVATFTHGTSRLDDPQLHTHCVLINMTKRSDGQIRALVNDACYANQMLIGSIYQNSLALSLRKLGYTILPNDDSTFEVKGYDQDQLDLFSKRRAEIVERGSRELFLESMAVDLKSRGFRFQDARHLREKGFVISNKDFVGVSDELRGIHLSDGLGVFISDYFGGRSYESIKKNLASQLSKDARYELALRTRKSKQFLPKHELHNIWAEQARSCQVHHPERKPLSQKELALGAGTDLNLPISHLSEQNSVFKQTDLEYQALRMNLGKLSYESMRAALEVHSSLIPLSTTPRLEILNFTTTELLAKERRLVREVFHARGRLKPLAREDRIRAKADRLGLSDEQTLALVQTLMSKDQVVAWDGVAGSGKSLACQIIKEIADEKGIRILSMAPDASSAKAFEKASLIPATTLDTHLIRNQENGPESGPQFWLVDEASKMSTSQASQLIACAKAQNARLLLLGDPARQLGSVAAGNPLRLLIESGAIPTCRLETHRRQKDPNLLASVEAASRMTKRGLEESKTLLEGQTKSYIDEKTRIQAVVKAVSNETEKLASGKTLVISDLNQERLDITAELRRDMMRRGVISDKQVDLPILVASKLSPAERRQANFYRKDLVIVPHRNCPLLDHKKRYQVTEVDKERNELTLSCGGSTERIKAEHLGRTDAFEPQSIPVAVGDLLRWRRNHEGRVNNHRLIVTEINNDKISVENIHDGKAATLDMKQGQYLDYGLVLTTYASQGHTADKGVFLAGKRLTKNTWYTAISRYRQRLEVITDRATEITERLKRSSQKENALDHHKSREELFAETKDSSAKEGKKELQDSRNTLSLKDEIRSARTISQLDPNQYLNNDDVIGGTPSKGKEANPNGGYDHSARDIFDDLGEETRGKAKEPVRSNVTKSLEKENSPASEAREPEKPKEQKKKVERDIELSF